MIETQLLETNLVDANLYLKDGSKKLVKLASEILNTPQQIIQFISNSNFSIYLETNNPSYIESIDIIRLDGIDVNLK